MIAKPQLERLSGALSRVTPTARAREILRQQLHRSLVRMPAPGAETPSKMLSWRAYAWDIYPGATTDSGQVRDILRILNKLDMLLYLQMYRPGEAAHFTQLSQVLDQLNHLHPNRMPGIITRPRTRT